MKSPKENKELNALTASIIDKYIRDYPYLESRRHYFKHFYDFVTDGKHACPHDVRPLDLDRSMTYVYVDLKGYGNIPR